MIRKLSLLVMLLCVAAAPVWGADVMSIDIYGPGQSRVNLFVADPLSKDSVGPLGAIPGNAPLELQQRIHANCAFLPFFNMLGGRDIVGGPNPGGYVTPSIDFKKFHDALVKKNYDGWCVVEQDLFPVKSFDIPLKLAKHGRENLRVAGFC